jgi:hypothetical protein
MYESLKANSSDFHLFIYAFDDLSYEILTNSELESATIISLKDFETPELKEVKETRTKAEYCWTCTPSVISHSILAYNLPECTYLDSDIFFYSDPAILISEMRENNKSIMITEHRFSLLPRWYELKRGGRFCVQFLTVKNEPSGIRVLEKWRRQCIDWCYARYEGGKFGDQKYVEEWPEKYNNVHILQHQGGGLAPWNITKYGFSLDNNRIKGLYKKKRETFDAVFFHFQYVKQISGGVFDIGWYFIPGKIRSLFYRQYLVRILKNEEILSEIDNRYITIFTKEKPDSIKNYLKTIFKKMTKFNIVKIT